VAVASRRRLTALARRLLSSIHAQRVLQETTIFLRCLPVERVDFLRADVASERGTIAWPKPPPRSKRADELSDPIQINRSFQGGVR
jgi:hypothetical protein